MSKLFFGIFGIFTNPSVSALKYKPVPPTIIGIENFFFYISIFLMLILASCPTEKFFLH